MSQSDLSTNIAMENNRKPSEGFNPYSLMSPRFWHGMRSSVWIKLLASHGFRVSPSKLHHVLGVSLFTPFNDLLGLTQHIIHGRKIAQTEPLGPPIFILGHWRSGTTYLHELLQMDDRFASPNTLQCLAPWHFLLVEGIACKFFQFLLPKQRPMDNMKVGWELPQEDEFALLNLGAPSEYSRIAFPREKIADQDQLSAEEIEYWKKSLDWFMRALTYHYGKPLVMKSPPHTGRIKILSEMYPNAKFIHLVRDPRKLFPSTVRLWRALDHFQSLQTDNDPTRIEAYVFRSLVKMYKQFHDFRDQLPPDRIVDIHYETLVADPVKTLESAYEQLGLGGFETVRDQIRNRKQSDKEYKTNQFKLNTELEKKILHEWSEYAIRYGYDRTMPSS